MWVYGTKTLTFNGTTLTHIADKGPKNWFRAIGRIWCSKIGGVSGWLYKVTLFDTRCLA
jgi:hypothetical protein